MPSSGERHHDERCVRPELLVRRWSQVLRESPEKVASRPPSPYLVAEIPDVQPGRALDAGCGRPPSCGPGHRHADAAAGQVQVSVDEAIEAFGSPQWDIVVAEDRPRAAVGTGVDAVIRAVSRPG